MIPMKGLADPFRIPKASFFDITCLGIICMAFMTGLRKRYFNKYLSYFIAWLFITIIFNWYLPFSITLNNRQSINIWTLEPTIHLFLAIPAIFIMCSYFELDDFRKISKTVCLSTVLVSSVCLLQVLGFDIFGSMVKYNINNHFCAFMDNPNVAGNYIALGIPFFLNYIKNIKYLIGFILSIIAVIFSRSQFSILISGISIIIYIILLLKNNRKIIYSILSVITLGIIGVGFNLSRFEYLLNGRLGAWKLALPHLKENPVFGQGLGIFKTFEMWFMSTRWMQLHNDWYERLLELGVVGIVFLVIILVNSIRKFDFSTKENVSFAYFSSFVCFVILMFGSFPLEVAPLALFGLLNFVAVETL